MEFPTSSSPHLQPPNQVSRVMLEVLIAAMPGTAAMVFYFGWGVAFNVFFAVGTALLAEAGMLRLRGQPVKLFLSDLSAVVAGLLLALAIPTLAPWWLPVIGAAFAIVVAKQLYGGLGYNPFNPAMAGYVVLLISFPREMTTWLSPIMLQENPLTFLQAARYTLLEQLPAEMTLDAITMATPLDMVKSQLNAGATLTEIHQSPLFGDFGGKGWEWIGNWFFLGGLWLIRRKIITWHIPVGVLGGLFLTSLFFYPLDPDNQPFPLFHIFSGAAILGAFFIATDPVSACTSNKGRLIYGFAIGVLIYIIRTWGGYPDGVAFAVLLMNMAAPTIDYYTQPRVFGGDER